MVDIFRQNFLDYLPEIKKAIDEAEFISFDYEFSGLSTCKFDEKSILDSDEVRYAKLKQVVEKLYGF